MMVYTVLMPDTRYLPQGGDGAAKVAKGERLLPGDYQTAQPGDVIDPDVVQVEWLVINGYVAPPDAPAAAPEAAPAVVTEPDAIAAPEAPAEAAVPDAVPAEPDATAPVAE